MPTPGFGRPHAPRLTVLRPPPPPPPPPPSPPWTRAGVVVNPQGLHRRRPPPSPSRPDRYKPVLVWLQGPPRRRRNSWLEPVTTAAEPLRGTDYAVDGADAADALQCERILAAARTGAARPAPEKIAPYPRRALPGELPRLVIKTRHPRIVRRGHRPGLLVLSRRGRLPQAVSSPPRG